MPYGYDVTPSNLCSLLSLLLLNVILLIFSMNTLCASLLGLCCDFSIISLFSQQFLKSSNLIVFYYTLFPFLFVNIAIICLITIHLCSQCNKLLHYSSVIDFIGGCVEFCLIISCKVCLNIFGFYMYYEAVCVYIA